MSNLLFDLPEGVQWNVMKFMRHPVAELFLNDAGVKSALDHISEWETVYEGIEDFNFQCHVLSCAVSAGGV